MNGKRALFFPEGSERIAADETVLWRGRPLVVGLAVRCLKLPVLLGYFALLALVEAGLSWRDGSAAVATALAYAAIGAVAVALLVLSAAALFAATTRYVLTDRRLILMIGIALPIALTVPLKRVAAAGLRLHPDGSGDLPLALAEGKLAYLLIWPHARPWRFRTPEPMLRCVPDAQGVAAILSRALLAAVPKGQAWPVEAHARARPAAERDLAPLPSLT